MAEARLSLSYDPPGATLRAFRASPAMARGLIGPLGGGREECAVYDILLRAVDGPQRRWRWVAIRNDMGGLEEQTIAAWHKVVPESIGEWDPRLLRHRVGFQIKGRPKDIEILFFALDRPEHRRRLATIEATGFWLDGARDLEEGIFDRALEAVGSWPSDEAPAPGVICTSLMPLPDHWLALRPDLARFRQPGGRTPQAENLAERGGSLKPGYYQRIATGRSPEWVRVMIDAEWAGQNGTPEEIQEKLDADKRAREKLYHTYPDEGPLRRELYPKHTEFFAAGTVHQERAFIGGNRTGKSFSISYEGSCHLTGWYPDWWQGFRWNRPITAWIAGEDAKAVRESLQDLYLGPLDALGTGLVPGDRLVRKAAARGASEAIDFFEVRHVSGGVSRALFKAYEQKRESFQAAKVDFMQFDEEPPLDIYTEGLTRTMSTDPGQPNGRVACGFTPLKGISATVLKYLPGGRIPETEELRKAAWGW